MKIDSSWIYSSCQVGARIWILSCFIANVNTNTISGVLSYGNMTLKHAIEHVKRVGISLVFMKSPWDMGYYMVWGRYRKLRSIFTWLQTFCKMIRRWMKGYGICHSGMWSWVKSGLYSGKGLELWAKHCPVKLLCTYLMENLGGVGWMLPSYVFWPIEEKAILFASYWSSTKVKFLV